MQIYECFIKYQTFYKKKGKNFFSPFDFYYPSGFPLSARTMSSIKLKRLQTTIVDIPIVKSPKIPISIEAITGSTCFNFSIKTFQNSFMTISPI